MFQNTVLVSVLLASAMGISATNVATAATNTEVHNSNTYQPKLKDLSEVKKLTQAIFHKTAMEKAKAPLHDIKSGKLKAIQRDPEELFGQHTATPVVIAEDATTSATHHHAAGALRGHSHSHHREASVAVAPVKVENLPPNTPPHTVFDARIHSAANHHAHGHVETEGGMATSRTKIFSPNKGFVEYTFYEDIYCSTPTNATGSAINTCYYDEETETSSADVVTFRKFQWGYTYFGVNTFVYDDMYCTSIDTANTTTDYWGSTRGYCYSQWGYNSTGSYSYLYSYKYDHVTVPTYNATSASVFSLYEYKTEAACNNWNADKLLTYGVLSSDDVGCVESMNEGEYFMLTCTDSVPQALIYSDSDCSVYLRSEDFSDFCESEYFTYPTRLICDSSV